jgi:hypothetical protein
MGISLRFFFIIIIILIVIGAFGASLFFLAWVKGFFLIYNFIFNINLILWCSQSSISWFSEIWLPCYLGRFDTIFIFINVDF